MLNYTFSRRLFWAFALAALVTALPELALAQVDDIGNLGSSICRIVQALQGNIGRGIATIAVIFLGIGAFFGKVNWGLAIMVAGGVILIFGAAEITDTVTDSGGDCVDTGDTP